MRLKRKPERLHVTKYGKKFNKKKTDTEEVEKILSVRWKKPKVKQLTIFEDPACTD